MVDVSSAPALTEADEWPETIPELQNGWRPTGGPPNPAADEGILNWPLQSLANRTRWLLNRQKERELAQSMRVTVGTGGDFKTINAACEKLAMMTPRLQVGAITAEIHLLAGFEMQEQLVVRGINLGWVEITAASPTVLIRRSALSEAVDGGDGTSYPAFSALGGGTLPIIGCLFSMTSDGEALSRNGIFAADGGRASVRQNCGIQNAGHFGASVTGGGGLSVEGADFRGAAQNCIRASRGGMIAARWATLTNSGGIGVYCHNGGTIDALSATITGATTYGVYASRAGRVNVESANCRRGGSDSSTDIYVEGGGIVSARQSTGGTNVVINTVTANGIIFK